MTMVQQCVDGSMFAGLKETAMIDVSDNAKKKKRGQGDEMMLYRVIFSGLSHHRPNIIATSDDLLSRKGK